jgi:hypothetical protein
MGDRSWKAGSQRHFVIRCWLETPSARQPFWRGRVQEVGGDATAFEDVRRMLDFILERLRRPNGIELPYQRDGHGDA